MIDAFLLNIFEQINKLRSLDETDSVNLDQVNETDFITENESCCCLSSFFWTSRDSQEERRSSEEVKIILY